MDISSNIPLKPREGAEELISKLLDVPIVTVEVTELTKVPFTNSFAWSFASDHVYVTYFQPGRGPTLSS